MKEHDVVVLLKDYPDLGLKAGLLATLVSEPTREWVALEIPGKDTKAFEDWRVESVRTADLRVATKAELDAERARSVAAE